MYHIIKQNKIKKGISANADTVVEVINSLTCSSSLICEMNVPVERGLAEFRSLNAWPKTRSDTRISARLPSKSEILTRILRITKSKIIAITTPINKT